ncbi:MAG: winged helix-turn-helix transcriptional regulator [Erysipelothrix sp.]|nr:winged helix-turn-helix transcriptional regulator [Erysipelothrix sp.]
MDLKSHTVVHHGNLIDLTPKEFEVLRIFLTKMNSVVSRDEMISIVWNEEVISDDSRVVDVHVQKL